MPRPGALLDFFFRWAEAEVATDVALLLDLPVLFEGALLDGGEYWCRVFFFLEDRRSLGDGVILLVAPLRIVSEMVARFWGVRG